MKRKYIHLIIVTDCGGSDEGRYRIAAERCFFPHDVRPTFFATESLNTLHSGFTTAAHALSSVDFFGPLRKGEHTAVLDNAAPRHGTENGRKLRGEERKPEGEEIYALRLQNGVWIVGPNAGYNFYFLKGQVVESFLVTDTSKRYTPFRSMEVMIPTFAKIFRVHKHPHLKLTPKKLQVSDGEKGVFVADWDSHGNIYLVSTVPDNAWVPPQGNTRAFRIGNKIARLRHVNGIFAGKTGEQTLTAGSLQLNGKPVYYIVVVGGNAHSLFGNPPVGTKVEIERE
ncbi:MAG: hypothetical protein Q7R88_00575 [bacterium]|nr:hypothetical protein [bacterium]